MAFTDLILVHVFVVNLKRMGWQLVSLVHFPTEERREREEEVYWCNGEHGWRDAPSGKDSGWRILLHRSLSGLNNRPPSLDRAPLASQAGPPLCTHTWMWFNMPLCVCAVSCSTRIRMETSSAKCHIQKSASELSPEECLDCSQDTERGIRMLRFLHLNTVETAKWKSWGSALYNDGWTLSLENQQLFINLVAQRSCELWFGNPKVHWIQPILPCQHGR